MLYIKHSDVILFIGIVLNVLSTGYGQVVTINDCPVDQTITTHRAFWQPPTVTGIGVILTGSHSPNTLFPDGETTVTYVAEDENGNINTNECSFKIIVDNTNAPTIHDCPSTVTATAVVGTTVGTATWTDPTATAINGDPLMWTFRSDAPGDEFSVGSNRVYYEFVDADDHGAHCEFTVQVAANVDTNGPTITCPEDITVNLPEGETEQSVYWEVPVPTGDPDVFLATHSVNETFGVGTTVVLYIVEDVDNNHDECEFNIIVKLTLPDTTPPTFTYCPDHINEIVGPTQATYVVTWDTPTANDTVSETDNIVITSDATSPYTAQVETSTTVTYTATDEAGNMETCIFMVTVSVDGVPTFQNCPLSKEVEMTMVNTPVTWTEPTVSDDSTVTSNYEPGDTFTGPAEYRVTYTAIDPFGSIAACSFDITIQDTTAPTIQGCPSNKVITVSAKNTATATWTEPTAEDNSGQEVSLNSDISSGSTFNNGETVTVTYTATDSTGLSATCVFTVQVAGTTACTTNPCENDGVCITDGEDDFDCICVDDFTGDTCSNDGLSLLQIIAIGLGSLAGLLILLLLLFCCCYYCCVVAEGESEPPTKVIVHKPPQPIHMGVGCLPEPVYDNRPLGARFHNDLPKKKKSKRARRFRHSNNTSRVKDATTGNYGRHQNNYY